MHVLGGGWGVSLADTGVAGNFLEEEGRLGRRPCLVGAFPVHSGGICVATEEDFAHAHRCMALVPPFALWEAWR